MQDERHTCHGELFSEVVTKIVCQSAQVSYTHSVQCDHRPDYLSHLKLALFDIKRKL